MKFVKEENALPQCGKCADPATHRVVLRWSRTRDAVHGEYCERHADEVLAKLNAKLPEPQE